jgi:hypothetical protein
MNQQAFSDTVFEKYAGTVELSLEIFMRFTLAVMRISVQEN